MDQIPESENQPQKKIKTEQNSKQIDSNSLTITNNDKNQNYNSTTVNNENQNSKLLQQQQATRVVCPYLSTIVRHRLDFDFEKLCSVTLQNMNVYACLVCGKYFQGRGKNTHAYTHSLEQNHHIFINLYNEKVYCLPDNYEVIDKVLTDIKYNLKPEYTEEQVKLLDINTKYARSLDGTDYLPGCVGLNNIKSTDYVNVVIQSLCRVPLLRQFCLINSIDLLQTTDFFDYPKIISIRFCELLRKIWNPQNFKGHVSPHELLQAISLKSKKKFRIDEQSDAVSFFQWFLDVIQKEIRTVLKSKKINGDEKNIISQCFQGEIEILTYSVNRELQTNLESQETKPFLFLPLEIPPNPLYKDEKQQNVIPHVPIYNLFKKFDGQTFQDCINSKKQYRLKKLPKYLIVILKRFSKNNFFMEKNPTIVSFPLNNLDIKPYISSYCNDENIQTKYNLLANICHEGKPKAGDGFYKVQVRHKALNQWFEIQDLHIKPVMPQLVSLSEAYIQIYEQIGQ